MMPAASAAMARRPRALLLDFGGVLVGVRKRTEGPADLAAHVVDRLRAAGVEADAERIAESLRAGLGALKDWRNAAARRRAPLELTHREVWQDFLASDLSDRAREVLGAQAGPLCEVMVRSLLEHRVREGVPELLRTARASGVRVGVVSNAHSGAAHRRVLAETGLAELIDVQLYSDEAGLRKPHPGLIESAALALDVTPAECWYVGDTQDRDLLAGRRAGVGAVVLVRHDRTDTPPYPVRETPDVVLPEPSGLIALLESSRPGQPPAPPAATRPAASRPAGAPPGRPAAVLLDFGGVVVTTAREPGSTAAFAAEIAAFLASCGHDGPDAGRIERDLERAAEEYDRFKHENDGGGDGREITHRGWFGDLVARDWPAGPRAALLAHATPLARRYTALRSRRTVRPGILAVMRTCADHGVPVAIVSNTLSGQALRDASEELGGILRDTAVRLFSDEAGFRKPDPRLITAAVTALGVEAADCWFVGDTPRRDVAGARRAGVGTTVLLEVPGRTLPSDGSDPAADLVLPDAVALHGLLEKTLAG